MLLLYFRLLEYAPTYFDIKSFPDGEAKRALQRVVNKLSGKAGSRIDSGTEDKRERKKRKKG